MPRHSPAIAKNVMRRALREVLDPYPKKKQLDEVWDYFKSKCAYCGEGLDRSNRNGHIDHITPSSRGGSNEIYNFVLACSCCNGDKKREEPWTTFLRREAEKNRFEKQRKLITSWLKRSKRKPLTKKLQKQVNQIVSENISSFDRSVKRLRKLKKK